MLFAPVAEGAWVKARAGTGLAVVWPRIPPLQRGFGILSIPWSLAQQSSLLAAAGIVPGTGICGFCGHSSGCSSAWAVQEALDALHLLDPRVNPRMVWVWKGP